MSRVVAAGGRVIDPPADAGEGGRAATCADPAGVQFRLWQARQRPGARHEHPGSWNFSDLVTADHEASVRFYGQVFGWISTISASRRWCGVPATATTWPATIDPGIHERQSGNAVPPGFADAIGWLSRAGDADPGWEVTYTAGRGRPRRDCGEGRGIGRQGGTPRGPDWTKDAVIADPTGGEFAGQQVPPPEGGD